MKSEDVIRLFDLYSNDLYKFAVSYLGSKQDAEDIVQEVFSKLLDKHMFFENRNEKAYLMTMTANKCKDHLKSSARSDVDLESEEWHLEYYDGFTDEELLSMLFSCELEFGPGTKYSYSNAGYTLLAMIIEKITGESYAEYVQKNIFDACGMEHSSSMATGDVTSIPEFVPDSSSPFPDPYEVVDTLYMQLIKPERGVGDIHSCAADLLLFDRALIGGKSVCEGYTTAFYLLCREADLWCTYRHGLVDGVAHVWNMIKLESGIYNVDVTWCDGCALNDPAWYDNFVRSEADFASDGHNASQGPAATGEHEPNPYQK